jgi:hypothetical protein
MGGITSEDLARQDKTMRRILLPILCLHPKTPRDAYDIAKGQQASDAEWEAYGAAWQRNWDECVELYNAVTQAEQALNQQYEKYQARTGRRWARWFGT